MWQSILGPAGIVIAENSSDGASEGGVNGLHKLGRDVGRTPNQALNASLA